VLVGYALNDVGLVVNDGVTNSSVGGPPFPDFGANSGATWAVWSADRITATVPEPSTVALLGVLALALPQLRRRRCG
jgi:hypothetical protein